jgi:hypothetical protein
VVIHQLNRKDWATRIKSARVHSTPESMKLMMTIAMLGRVLPFST